MRRKTLRKILKRAIRNQRGYDKCKARTRAARKVEEYLQERWYRKVVHTDCGESVVVTFPC